MYNIEIVSIVRHTIWFKALLEAVLGQAKTPEQCIGVFRSVTFA